MRLMTAVLIVTLLPTRAVAQVSTPDVWHDFAGNIAIGAELNVRLVDGVRFRAMLVRVDEAALVLQPKTRVPAPVQAVPYTAIASLETTRKGGMGAVKAAAIGVGTGAAVFWAMVGITLMVFSD
jgi:hypothetical protein